MKKYGGTKQMKLNEIEEALIYEKPQIRLSNGDIFKIFLVGIFRLIPAVIVLMIIGYLLGLVLMKFGDTLQNFLFMVL